MPFVRSRASYPRCALNQTKELWEGGFVGRDMFPGAIRRDTKPKDGEGIRSGITCLLRTCTPSYTYVTFKHGCHPLSPWVASLALSWPTHRSDMWTYIEALPPCRLSMAGRRRVRPLVQPPGHMPARRGAGARKRQPGRSVGVSEPKPAVMAVEAVAVMAVVTGMGRQQRFDPRSTHSVSIRKRLALVCS